MSQQPITSSKGAAPGSGAPWSPLMVGVITLFLPAGGVALAIRDLQRLGAIERGPSRQLIWISMAVLTAGYAALTLTAPRHADGTPVLDSNAAAFISAALGVAMYLALRQPFLRWRSQSSRRLATILPALATALLYQTLVVIAVVIVVLVFGPAAGLNTL